MKYEDDLYEITDDANAEEDVEVEAGESTPSSKKKAKRPHNYQVRRQLEDYLEERELRHTVDYFNDLV